MYFIFLSYSEISRHTNTLSGTNLIITGNIFFTCSHAMACTIKAVQQKSHSIIFIIYTISNHKSLS